MHDGPSSFRAHERFTRGDAVASWGRTSAKNGYTALTPGADDSAEASEVA
ncbi:hypothetical protein [Streptomyces sp. NPDC058867]